MNVLKFDERMFWMAARQGKITGSKLKDIIVYKGKERKIGSYAVLAELLGVPDDSEFPMERGQRLEKEALERFEKETEKKVDSSLLMWEREEDPRIAVSPDGVISETEACEVKCLKSSLHIKAFITQEIPDEYFEQMLQYFVVNDRLQTLHFILYDPRFDMFPGEVKKKGALDFFVIEIHRADVAEEVEKALAYQVAELKWMDEWVTKLTF